MEKEMNLNERILSVKKILQENYKNGITKGCLFLDFDGVINVFYEPGSEKWKKANLQPDTFEFCDRKIMKTVSDFCLEEDMEIVISSSWRFSGLEYCTQYLRQYGLCEEVNVIGTTQMDWYMSREEEVMAYVQQHPLYARLIVLDDMEMPHLKEFAVQTDPFIGFDDERKDIAKKLASKQIIYWTNGSFEV